MSTKAYAAQSATSPLAPFGIKRRDPLPNEVEIDILFCGVCHSDLHMAAANGATAPTLSCRVTKLSGASRASAAR